MKDVKIRIPDIIDVDISGPKDQTKVVLIKMKSKVWELGGRILIEEEFSDGFSLSISFTDSNKKRLFEMEFGL